MTKSSLTGTIGNADIKLLRIFQSVVDSGGLSAAETELNIGRSTISKHIADLEIRLDLKLCNRGPAGFSLTEDGENVLLAAQRLLSSVAEFRAEVNELRKKLAGTLRIALFDQSTSNPESHLARVIARYNQAAPQVEIDLSIEPPNVVETMVIGGTLDLGIIAMHRPSASLDYAPLYGENMFLYCGRGHPFFEGDQDGTTLEDIRAVNYAGISVNSPNLHIGQTLGLRRAAKVQSEEALATLILSGRYVGFLPDHQAQHFVETGLIKEVLPDEVHYRSQFAVVTRKRPVPNRMTKLFRDMLIKAHPA